MGKSAAEKKKLLCLVGQQEKDFDLLTKAGKGGFGTVYKARSKFLDVVVALKTIDKTCVKAEGLYEQYRREVEIHSDLKHPAVLELFATFEDRQKYWLVLEHCDTDMRVCRQTDEATAAAYVWQIAQGLQYIHREGYLHMDIKPANLMAIMKDGAVESIKIGDFSLATRIGHHFNAAPLAKPQARVLYGTRPYISPEVLRNEAPTPACDVWALGCCLYQFLAGQLPPVSSDGRFRAELSEHWSDATRDAVARLLHPEASRRLTLDELLRHPYLTGNLPRDLSLSTKVNPIRHLLETKYARSWQDSTSVDPPTTDDEPPAAPQDGLEEEPAESPGSTSSPRDRAALRVAGLVELGCQSFTTDDGVRCDIRHGGLEIQARDVHFGIAADGQWLWRRAAGGAVERFSPAEVLADDGLRALFHAAQQVSAQARAGMEAVRLRTATGGLCRVMADGPEPSFAVHFYSKCRGPAVEDATKSCRKQEGLVLRYNKCTRQASVLLSTRAPPSFLRRRCRCPPDVLALSAAHPQPTLAQYFHLEEDLRLPASAPSAAIVRAVRQWWGDRVVRAAGPTPTLWWQHPAILQTLDEAASLLDAALHLQRRPHAAFAPAAPFRVKSSGQAGCLTTATLSHAASLPPHCLFPLSVTEQTVDRDPGPPEAAGVSTYTTLSIDASAISVNLPDEWRSTNNRSTAPCPLPSQATTPLSSRGPAFPSSPAPHPAVPDDPPTRQPVPDPSPGRLPSGSLPSAVLPPPPNTSSPGPPAPRDCLPHTATPRGRPHDPGAALDTPTAASLGSGALSSVRSASTAPPSEPAPPFTHRSPNSSGDGLEQCGPCKLSFSPQRSVADHGGAEGPRSYGQGNPTPLHLDYAQLMDPAVLQGLYLPPRQSDSPLHQLLAKVVRMWLQDPSGDWPSLLREGQRLCQEEKRRVLAGGAPISA